VKLHLGGRRVVFKRKGVKCIFISQVYLLCVGFWGTRSKGSVLSYLRVSVQPELNWIIHSAALSKSVCESSPLENYFSNNNKVQGKLCVLFVPFEYNN